MGTVVIWRIVVIGAAITTLYTVQEEYSIHYTGGVQYICRIVVIGAAITTFSWLW